MTFSFKKEKVEGLHTINQIKKFEGEKRNHENEYTGTYATWKSDRELLLFIKVTKFVFFLIDLFGKEKNCDLRGI